MDRVQEIEYVQCLFLLGDDNPRTMCNVWFIYIYYLVKSKNFILRTLNVIMNVDFIGHYKIENNFHNLFLLTLICITAVQVNFQ